jgi:hypothetical protein
VISLTELTSKKRLVYNEVLQYKKQEIEARKELDILNQKSKEVESIVSLIQRAWSQVIIIIS